MRLVSNRWLRVLLLINAYMFGALGIMATGGGGGGGNGDQVSVVSIQLDPAESPTYEPGATISGSINISAPRISNVGDSYSGSVSISWHNRLTGESGTFSREFSGSCYIEFIFINPFLPPVPVTTCTSRGNPLLSIPLALGVGTNEITIGADGKEASLEIVRMIGEPFVETTSASSIGAYQADISGVVNPKGLDTNTWLEYSSDPGLSPANSTPPSSFTASGRDQVLSETITGLSDASVYYYRIVAENSEGQAIGEIKSFATLDDSAAPTVPEMVEARSTSTQTPQILVTWEEATDDFLLAGYRIYRDGVLIDSVTSLEFADTGLDANTQYCYRVSAYDLSLNESNLSDEACATTSWVSSEIASDLERIEVSLALDQSDNVHIAFTSQFYISNPDSSLDYFEELSYSNNTGGSWSTQKLDDGRKPYIAIDSSGAVHIGYTFDFYVSKYATNRSGDWMSESLGGNLVYSTGLDTLGNAYILRGLFPSASYLSNNSTGVWISENVPAGRYSAMVVDSTDSIHIAFYDESSMQLKYSDNSSGTWTTEVVETGSEILWDTALAIDDSGNAHISYYDMTNRDLKYATNASGTWVVEIPDSQDDVGSGSSIAVDGSGDVHISYTDQTNNNLKYATNTSGVWRSYTIDSTVEVTGIGWGDQGSYADPGNTSIAVDSANKIHIGYHGGELLSSNKVDVWYATNR